LFEGLEGYGNNEEKDKAKTDKKSNLNHHKYNMEFTEQPDICGVAKWSTKLGGCKIPY
jgi:hypothetical protein